MTGAVVKIAITGPTGVIGSEMVELALSSSHDVIAITRPGSSRNANIGASNHLKIIECDISDYDSIAGKEKCDIFFHLAWKSTNVNNRDDLYPQVDNIRYTLDAVRLAHSWGAKMFVGAGSQAEYGPSHGIIDETTPERPESGYGMAKLSAGMMSKLLGKQLGIKVCWARILSVYGKRDMDHTLIMYIIKTLMKNESPELTKCEQIWDYLYAKDAAKAMIAIGLKGKDGKTYPVASGRNRKLSEYVLDIKNVLKSNAEIRFGAKDYYPHQPMVVAADISGLTEDTGFVPEYSFKEGIREMIDFLRGEDRAE